MNAGDLHAQLQEENQNDDAVTELSLERLKALAALGRGAKGVVFLVRDEEEYEQEQEQEEEENEGEEEKYLALKVILRDSLERRNKAVKDDTNNKNGRGDCDAVDEYKRVYFERKVLRSLKHPLLPRLHGFLATEKVLGYAIDYCPGRDLNSLRKQQTEKMFSDDIIRFYAAELVLALEYLHNSGIVYRDLKPENIMIQQNGHIMLVDFDLSTKLLPKSTNSSPSPSFNSVATKKPNSVVTATKTTCLPFYKRRKSGISPDDSATPTPNSAGTTESYLSGSKSNSFVGTEEYVAPEIIQGKGHDFVVDWWSLGVVLYEMLYGTTPFKGENRKETFFRILTKEPQLIGETTPLRDLIRKLLEKDQRLRISVEEIKGHDFFKGLDWDSVLTISRPPYIPPRVLDEFSEEGEDKKGIKKIDVELFVQGIFGGGVENKKKVDEIKNNTSVNNDGGEENTENVDKKLWVNGINHEPCETDHFFVF